MGVPSNIQVCICVSVIEPHKVLQLETGVRQCCPQGNVNLGHEMYNQPCMSVIGVPRLLGR